MEQGRPPRTAGWQQLALSPHRGVGGAQGWVMWTLSLYGTGPLIATFATWLLYGPWVVPRESLSLVGTNE